MTRIMPAFISWIGLLVIGQAAWAGCSVHDHGCQFHGIGAAVNHTVNQNDPTAVYIVSVGSNNTDFDNNVLLPDGVGPYVVSTTGFPSRSDQPYVTGGEQPRHVYPSQFQIDFQQNTVQARHSGDLNGLGSVPGATGCRISGGGTACEEISIIGNLPDPGDEDGFVVRQTNHLYNAYNVSNPSVSVSSYAVVTGRAYFKNDTHIAYQLDNPDFNTQISGIEVDNLSGTGALGAEKVYNIGYNDFDAHAAGDVTFYNQLWQDPTPKVYRTQYGHASDHLIADATQRRYKNYDYTISFGQTDPNSGQRVAFKTYDNVNQYYKTSYSNVRVDPVYQRQQRQIAENRQKEITALETAWARECRDSTCSNLPIVNVFSPEGQILNGLISSQIGSSFEGVLGNSLGRSSLAYQNLQGNSPIVSDLKATKRLPALTFRNAISNPSDLIGSPVSTVGEVILGNAVGEVGNHYYGENGRIISQGAAEVVITGVATAAASTAAAPAVVVGYGVGKTAEATYVGYQANQATDVANRNIERGYISTNEALKKITDKETQLGLIDSSLSSAEMQLELNSSVGSYLSLNLIDGKRARDSARDQIEQLNVLKNEIDNSKD